MEFTRRESIKIGAAASLGLGTSLASFADANVPSKKIAACATIYRRGSHADVILGKILEGWKQDGGPGPALELVSLYVEQFPDDDLARAMCRKHGVKLCDSIEQAVTVAGDGVPDGVISIAEHGNYPFNDQGQHLYPRRRFFEEITDAFKKHGKVVPVFSDKHLGPEWKNADWMYRRAVEMRVPFMAGSSLPVSFRKPSVTIPMNCEIEAAVGIGYDGLDIYGSHALDSLQCILERRRGAEAGVKWVQFLEGDAVQQAVDDGTVSRDVFNAALAVVPKVHGNIPEKLAPKKSLFLFEYEDGLLGAQFMLQSVNRTAVAVKLKGHDKPMAMQFEERTQPRHPHFAYLLKGIERMMHTGRPSYPVERTYLTSGILDRAITSRAKGGKRLMTPELSIRYKPVDYPHAPMPDLLANPTL